MLTRASLDDMASPFKYIWQCCRFYPVLYPLPFGAQMCTHTHTHTHACMYTYIYSPEPHYDMAFPVFTCMGLCSLSRVISLIPNLHTTHTHIPQNPKDSIIACPGLCQHPNLSFSSSPQSSHKQRHRHLCTQHTLLHPEAHTSMAFPIVTCVGYAACLALFLHLQRTQPVGAAVILGTSWFGPAAQLGGGTVLIT